MGWKEVSNKNESSSSFMKWNKPGTELCGKWLGTKEGKFENTLGVIDDDEKGEIQFPFLTVLENHLEEVAEGVRIKIVYKGQVTSKDGTMYKAFQVFIEE